MGGGRGNADHDQIQFHFPATLPTSFNFLWHPSFKAFSSPVVAFFWWVWVAFFRTLLRVRGEGVLYLHFIRIFDVFRVNRMVHRSPASVFVTPPLKRLREKRLSTQPFGAYAVLVNFRRLPLFRPFNSNLEPKKVENRLVPPPRREFSPGPTPLLSVLNKYFLLDT